MNRTTHRLVARATITCFLTFVLVMSAAGVAVAQQNEDEDPEGIEFLPCGMGFFENQLNNLNNLLPLDIGRCEDGYLIPGEDTQDVFDQIPDDLPDPDDLPLPDDLPDPDDLPIPDDLPDPDDLPTDPSGLPDQLNCKEHEEWDHWADMLLWDPDCSGYPLLDQVLAGCDPINPHSHPGNPSQCNPPPEGTDDVERWAVGVLPSGLRCSDPQTVQQMVDQLLWDPDCSGHDLITQLEEGCNPFNPGSQPGSPFTPCLGEPDPTNSDWQNHTQAWVLMQAFWLIMLLPPWIAALVLEIVFQLLQELPELPA